MVRAALVLAFLAVQGTGAEGQNFDGVWQVEERQQIGFVRYELTISGAQFALVSSLNDNMGYFYQTHHFGRTEFYPPDNLRLVVLDYEPKVWLGQDVPPPAAHNLKVLAFDGRFLTLMSNTCAAQAPAQSCTSTYRRVR